MILLIQQLIKISLPVSDDPFQVPYNYTLFVLYLIILGEILGHFVSGLRYPRSFFHPTVFSAPRTTRSLPSPWLLLLLSLRICLPAYLCPLALLFLLISWGSPPNCIANHILSYSQNRRAPLLPPLLHTLHWSYCLQHLPKSYFNILFF